MWLFDLCFFLLLYLILYYLFYFILFSRGSHFPFFFSHSPSHVSSHPTTDAALPPLTSSTSESIFKSQSSLTVFEQRNETVSLTQRLLAWGKKTPFETTTTKKNPSEHSIAHTAFHSSCYAAPVHHISFQRLLSFLFTVGQPPIPKVLCYSAWYFCKKERQWFTYNNCKAWVSIANWP